MKTTMILVSLLYAGSVFAAGEARVDCSDKGQGQQQGKGQGQQQGQQQGKGKGQGQGQQQGQGKGQGQQQGQQQGQGQGQQQGQQQGKGQGQQQQECQTQQQQEACDTIYKACSTAGYDSSDCVSNVLNGRSNVSVNMGDQMACVQFKNENPDQFRAWLNKLDE